MVVRARISQPIPHHLSLVIGDIVHNLRSAFDHLAYQAVIAGGDTPTTNTEFPVSWDSADKHKSR